MGGTADRGFADRDAPRYMIHDRDGTYGLEFRRRVQSLGVKEIINRTTKSVAEWIR